MDKFYTRESTVKLCMDHFEKTVNVDSSNDLSNDLVIEPSAGDGAFVSSIKAISNNYLFFDIEPENKEIQRMDYLKYEHCGSSSKTHVVGNPPFGRQSSTAIKFIKKSCEFCDTCSFILPRSFKKPSLQRAFPLNFHLVLSIDLPCNSFLVDGKEYNVPCVFQIWKKSDINRSVKAKEVPINFEFVSKDSSYDISFRRVGVNAGMIEYAIPESQKSQESQESQKKPKSPSSHYFIKLLCSDESIVEELSRLTYDEKNDTVGPRSISKQELIHKFNSVTRNSVTRNSVISKNQEK